MMTIIPTLLAICLGGARASAQTVGATNLLTRGPGAEAAALGSTVLSTIHDPTALYWNPAGLTYAGGAITGEHLFLFDGARYDFIGLSVPSSIGTLGLGALQLDRGNIVARTAIDDPGTTVSNSQTDFLVGFARRLGEHFSAGGTANILDFNLAGDRAVALGVDVGGQGGYPGENLGALTQPFWSMGAVVKNLLPPSIRLVEDRETLPREFRGGLSLSFDAFSRAAWDTGLIQSDRGALSMSIRRVSGDPATYLGMGASYTFANRLVIRLGYDNGLSGGFGLKTSDGRFALDYSIENRTLNLNNRFTMTYAFSEPRITPQAASEEVDEDYAKALTRAQALSQENFLKGQQLFKGSHYEDAVEPLRLAALLDPDSREKARTYQRAREVGRRERTRLLSDALDADVAPGHEAQALQDAAAMLDLNPANRKKVSEILQKLPGRMADADFLAGAKRILEDRRERILTLSAKGFTTEALALVDNLVLSQSSGTAEEVNGLRSHIITEGGARRETLAARYAQAESSGDPAAALRAAVALARAYPEEKAIFRQLGKTRADALKKVSMTLKQRLYVRRLYFLAAIRFANQDLSGCRDLLDELLRQDAADDNATILEDALLRSESRDATNR